MKKKEENESLHDATAQWIATGIVQVQLRIARRLSRWEKGISPRRKKIMLLLFCMIGGLYFLYLLGRSFTRPAKQEGNHKKAIQSILPPKEKIKQDSLMLPRR